MVSRRNVVHTIAAAGAAALGARVTDVLSAGAQTGPTPVNFAVPAGACDCHVHVFGDPRRFPLSADRPYTPPPAPVAALRRVLNELHMDRVVIVSPAVYGASNECTLDAIRQLGSRARGIALYLAQTSDAELERLRRYGIRGLRLNLETFGVTDPHVAGVRFRVVSMQAAERGLHIQINTRLAIVEALEEQILSGPVTVIFDHFAQAQAALGIDQPGFAALVRLLRAGRAYVKISAPYRISAQPPDYLDAMPLAQALIAANSQRAVRDAILVENPARLYGFER